MTCVNVGSLIYVALQVKLHLIIVLKFFIIILNSKMKVLKLMLSGALFMTAAAGIVSCKDDNGVISEGAILPVPSQVFTEGIPAEVAGMTISRNAAGLVTSIVSREENVTFTYGDDATRADEFDVIMKVQDIFDRSVDTYYLQLNGKGYVTYAREIDSDGDREDWWFEYNADDQLSYVKRTDDDTLRATYTDGNLTRVLEVDEDGGGDTEVYDIYYTLNAGDAMIPNKGNIMLFDDTLGMDIDDMQAAYFAGMLGRSTRCLPVKCVEDGIYTEIFTWTLSANGLPERLTTISGSGGFQDVMNFVW